MFCVAVAAATATVSATRHGNTKGPTIVNQARTSRGIRAEPAASYDAAGHLWQVMHAVLAFCAWWQLTQLAIAVTPGSAW